MNLLNQVRSREGDETLLVYRSGCLTRPKLHGIERRYGRLLQKMAGRRIACFFHSMPHLAKALLLLDGLCQQLLLLPADLDDTALQHFLDSSSTELVLTDQKERLSSALYFTEDAGTPPVYAHETVWLLPTSGTTGVPKLIPHTLKSLSRTVRQKSSEHWGLLYEINRFAGLQVYLQAVLGGGILVIPEYPGLLLEEQMALFAQAKVNALSATPTLWRKILMSGHASDLLLYQVTLGGEIASQEILDALKDAYSQARLTHVYASTELGVGFSVSDGYAGFPSTWLDDSTCDFSLDSATGELCCRRSGVVHGTGDQVVIQGARAIFVGRLNGSINVGGNKVMPETVEEVLMQHPSVSLAVVSALRSPIMGNLVKAEIVLRNHSESDEESRRILIEYCRRRLQPFQVPAIINFVETITVSANGKIRRAELP